MGKTGDARGAIALYKILLRERPGLTQARMELANLLVATGDRNGAINELERIVESHPENIVATFKLAELLRLEGQWAKALPVYKRILDAITNKNKSFPQTLQGLSSIETLKARTEAGIGLCLKALGHPKEAITYLEQALTHLNTRDDLEKELALTLTHLGNTKNAILHFQKAYPSYEDDPEFLSEYALALIKMGRPEKAEKIYIRMTECLATDNTLSPEKKERLLKHTTEIFIPQYLIYSDSGKAIDLLEQAHRSLRNPDQTNGLLSILVRLYFANHQYLKACESLEDIVKNNPDNREGLFFLARSYEKLQLIKPAISAWERLYEKERSISTLTHLLELLVEQGKFKRAQMYLPEVFKYKFESDKKLKKLVIFILLHEGEIERAKKVLSWNLLNNDPDLLRTYLASAFSNATGNEIFENFCQKSPIKLDGYSDFLILKLLLKRLIDTKCLKRAEQILQSRWRTQRSIWTLRDIEDVYSLSGDRKSLLISLENELSDFPSSQRETLIKARLLIQTGNNLEAERILLHLLSTGSAWTKEWTCLYLGHIANLHGQYEKAMEYLDAIIMKFPNHVAAHIEKGNIFCDYGITPEAFNEFSALFELTGEKRGCSRTSQAPDIKLFADPRKIISSDICRYNNIKCQIELANSYENMNALDEAVSVWHGIIKRHPYYWPGYQSLFQLYNRLGKKKKAGEIKKMACRALTTYDNSEKFLSYSFIKEENSPYKKKTDPSELDKEYRKFPWMNGNKKILEEWTKIFCK